MVDPPLETPPINVDDEANNPTNPTNQGRKTIRGKSFSTVEDVLACKAFFAASTNPVKGSKMHLHQLQSDIEKAYSDLAGNQWKQDILISPKNATQPSPYAHRSGSSIYQRYKKTIQRLVIKFHGCVETNPDGSYKFLSSENEDSFLERMMQIYHDRYGEKFNFLECYLFLKTQPKFMELKEMNNKSNVLQGKGTKNKSQPNLRPLGQKKAKTLNASDKVVSQRLGVEAGTLDSQVSQVEQFNHTFHEMILFAKDSFQTWMMVQTNHEKGNDYIKALADKGIAEQEIESLKKETMLQKFRIEKQKLQIEQMENQKRLEELQGKLKESVVDNTHSQFVTVQAKHAQADSVIDELTDDSPSKASHDGSRLSKTSQNSNNSSTNEAA